MTRICPDRIAVLVLAVGFVIGFSACRKVKKPDNSPDVAVPGNGEEQPRSGGGPSRPALPTGWQEFKHPEGVYSIYVLAKPTRPRNSHVSLNLKKPLQSLEARESIYEIVATKQQPLTCSMVLVVFHPDGRAAYNGFEAKPRTLPKNWTLKADTQVTWGGMPATELIVEKSFPGHTPSRIYSVMHWCLTSDRAYQFHLDRTDRMPDEKERAAFFDSFKPGN